MSKIICYFDLHYGDDRPPYDDSSVHIYGTRALELQKAISIYAQQNNVTTTVCGGDESYFNPDPATHLKDAQVIAKEVTNTTIPFHRLTANHEPIHHIKNLGFTPTSYRAVDGNTNIIICQIDIKQENGVTLYRYDRDHIRTLIDEAKQHGGNILVASHWSLDRVARGYNKVSNPNKGYVYTDTLEPLADILKEANKNGNTVTSFHGHEHRFSMNCILGFDCVVMPAITQGDIREKTKEPCGLFAEITNDGENGGLRTTFKKIVLDAKEPDGFTVHTVTKGYMNQYYRPVKP